MEKDVVRELNKYLDSKELEKPISVIWFCRLQCGKVQTKYGSWIQLAKKGTPDFIIVIIGKDKRLQILFVEVKSEDVRATPRKGAQTDWVVKYASRHSDINYMIAQSVDEVKAFIKSLAFDAVNSIEF